MFNFDAAAAESLSTNKAVTIIPEASYHSTVLISQSINIVFVVDVITNPIALTAQ